MGVGENTLMRIFPEFKAIKSPPGTKRPKRVREYLEEMKAFHKVRMHAWYGTGSYSMHAFAGCGFR